jgi:hypothetical protein
VQPQAARSLRSGVPSRGAGNDRERARTAATYPRAPAVRPGVATKLDLHALMQHVTRLATGYCNEPNESRSSMTSCSIISKSTALFCPVYCCILRARRRCLPARSRTRSGPPPRRGNARSRDCARARVNLLVQRRSPILLLLAPVTLLPAQRWSEER